MIYFLIFIIGLFMGSFLGVLTDRIPKKETVIKGRSHCDFCKKELNWIDLIPMFSYIFQKGKCRYCSTNLSIYYPVIELVTGIISVFVYIFILLSQHLNLLTFNLNVLVDLVYYLLIAYTFIVIFFMDLKYGIIADRLLFFGIVLNVFYLIVFRSNLIFNHLISAIVTFLFFIVIAYTFSYLTKKESIGGGDIKLSFFLGLFLGFPKILVTLYIAFLTGAILAIILILWKKKSFAKGTLPFGPFLILGAFISLFWGDIIFSKVLILLGI